MIKLAFGAIVIVSLVFLFSRDPQEQLASKGVSGAANAGANDANRSAASPTLTPVEKLERAQPSALTPDGELAQIFTFGSDYTDLQRQLKFKEIRGKVVEWRLPVYDIKQSGDGYTIQTSASYKNKPFGPKVVATMLRVTPRGDDDRRTIERLKTGDLVGFKGVIEDVTLRHLEIKPAVLTFDPETFAKQLLDKTYGQYQLGKDGWRAVYSEDKNRPEFLMRLFRMDKITLDAVDRYYVLALGEAIDEKGEPEGTHARSGMVGAFVVEVRNGQPDVVSGNATILSGESGKPPERWNFVKLGSADYWGWQSKSNHCNMGGCGADYVILAPYGKSIRNVANGLFAFKETLANGEAVQSLDFKLHIDSSQGRGKVFPLLLTVTGKVKGQEIAPQTLKVPFDEKLWAYVPPKIPKALEGDDGGDSDSAGSGQRR